MVVAVAVCALNVATHAAQPPSMASAPSAALPSTAVASSRVTPELTVEAQAMLEPFIRQQLQRFPQPPSPALQAECSGRFPVSRYGDQADPLAQRCESMVRTRFQQLSEQWSQFVAAVGVLRESVARRSLDRTQWSAQCLQSVGRTLSEAPEEIRQRAQDHCKNVLDTALTASTLEQQKRFDEARSKVEVNLSRLTVGSDASQICSETLKPLGQGHPRETELREYCLGRVSDRLTQLNMTVGGGGQYTSQCGNLLRSDAYSSSAISCLVRWFTSNPGCKGNKCRAEIAVGNTRLWVHPPALGEEVVLIPQGDMMFRTANRVAIDVSINKPSKLDMQLRFVTEGGKLTDIIAKSVQRQEAAASVGLQIGEAVVVVASSDVTGALMPIVDQVANHYMSEHFQKKHRAAIESDDAAAATAVASSLSAVYNTIYRHSAGRTSFVTHVCFEAGSSDGKYTGFLKGVPNKDDLAFDRRCRDNERWEIWSTKRLDGTLRDGDEVYLRSHDGGWLSADGSGERMPGVYYGRFPSGAAARSMLWQFVSGDGRQIIESAAVIGTVGRTVNRISSDECLLPLRTGNSCEMAVRLRSARYMQWLDARPDNQHAGAVMGLFTKSYSGLRSDLPVSARAGAPYAGYFNVHRWYGSSACTQGERMRDLNCLPAKVGPNIDYQSGY
jgi:hypothetical protein